MFCPQCYKEFDCPSNKFDIQKDSLKCPYCNQIISCSSLVKWLREEVEWCEEFGEVVEEKKKYYIEKRKNFEKALNDVENWLMKMENENKI